ncbi:cytochrome P450 [Nocardioides sp. BGMRC 2183]|nr:cytochrome P450 [Nocardioides sp. BGMRC 2183]
MSTRTDDHHDAHRIEFDNTDPNLAPHLFETLRSIQRETPVAWTDAVGGYWALTKYDDITSAANDWETFTVEKGHNIPAPAMAVRSIPAELDPPVHTAWRKHVMPHFTPRRLAAWRPQIEAIVADAFADLVHTGSADLVRQVAWRVPTSVISAILGFAQQWEYVSEITEEWMVANSDRSDPERAKRAAAAVEQVVMDELEQRIGRPGDDILGEIVNGRIDGRPIPLDQLRGLTNALIIAGHSTTVDGIVNTLHRVLSEPGLFDRLKADRALLPAVIDESLRLAPPAWNMGRTARAEVEVRGVRIRPEEKVMLTFGAGNFDPDRFEDPERFDPGRDGVHRHLTFGYGRHRCIGEALAKLEIQIAVEHVIDHLPDLEVAGEPEPRTGFSTYGLRSLNVQRSGATAAEQQGSVSPA